MLTELISVVLFESQFSLRTFFSKGLLLSSLMRVKVAEEDFSHAAGDVSFAFNFFEEAVPFCYERAVGDRGDVGSDGVDYVGKGGDRLGVLAAVAEIAGLVHHGFDLFQEFGHI